MRNTESFASEINGKLPDLKIGSLRFWGHWFGRPYDAFHRIVSCSSLDDKLILCFNENEVLSVWSPVGLTASSTQFRIAQASRVRWEWFYYGRPQTSENLFFEDVERDGALRSNADWHTPNSTADFSQAAAELL
jgi:hypothetical protein